MTANSDRTTFSKAEFAAWKRNGEVAERARDGTWNLEIPVSRMSQRAIDARLLADDAARALDVHVVEIKWFRELPAEVAEVAINNAEPGLFRSPFTVRGSSTSDPAEPIIWLEETLAGDELAEVVHHEVYHLAHPDAPEDDAAAYGRSMMHGTANVQPSSSRDEWTLVENVAWNSEFGGDRPERNSRGFTRWVYYPPEPVSARR